MTRWLDRVNGGLGFRPPSCHSLRCSGLAHPYHISCSLFLCHLIIYILWISYTTVAGIHAYEKWAENLIQAHHRDSTHTHRYPASLIRACILEAILLNMRNLKRMRNQERSSYNDKQ